MGSYCVSCFSSCSGGETTTTLITTALFRCTSSATTFSGFKFDLIEVYPPSPAISMGHGDSPEWALSFVCSEIFRLVISFDHSTNIGLPGCLKAVPVLVRVSIAV